MGVEDSVGHEVDPGSMDLGVLWVDIFREFYMLRVGGLGECYS